MSEPMTATEYVLIHSLQILKDSENVSNVKVAESYTEEVEPGDILTYHIISFDVSGKKYILRIETNETEDEDFTFAKISTLDSDDMTFEFPRLAEEQDKGLVISSFLDILSELDYIEKR